MFCYGLRLDHMFLKLNIKTHYYIPIKNKTNEKLVLKTEKKKTWCIGMVAKTLICTLKIGIKCLDLTYLLCVSENDFVYLLLLL